MLITMPVMKTERDQHRRHSNVRLLTRFQPFQTRKRKRLIGERACFKA